MRVRPSEHHRVPTRVPGPGGTGRNPGASWGAHRTKEGLAPWWGRERSRWSLCGARSRGRTERGGLGTRPWCGLPRPKAIGGRRPGAPGGAAGPARTSRSLAPGAGPLRFADPSQEKQRGRAGAGACSLQARRPGGWCADPCAGRGPGLERAPSGSLRVAQRGVQGWGPTPGKGGAWVVPAAAQMKGTVGKGWTPAGTQASLDGPSVPGVATVRSKHEAQKRSNLCGRRDDCRWDLLPRLLIQQCPLESGPFSPRGESGPRP